MKVKIDGKKFKDVVKSYDYSLTKLSTDIGYSASYLSTCAMVGEMEERVLNLIETVAGIPRTKILDTKTFVAREDLTEDELRLYTIINKACYDAFCGALKKWGGLI